MTIKLIAFDIGGVLADINKRPLAYLLNEKAKAQKYNHNFIKFQRGLIDYPNFQKLNAEVFFPDENHIFTTLFSSILKANKNIKPLNYLTKNYVFFSNINELHYKNFLKDVKPNNFALKNSILSYKIRALKPEPEFFKKASQRLNLPPQHILLVDDREENLAMAKNYGYQTHHFKGSFGWFNKLGTDEAPLFFNK